MPESKGRAKASYTPPRARPRSRSATRRGSCPVMVGLFILGLLWIVTFYVTQGAYPIPALHVWNLAVGFGLLMAGLRHDDPLALSRGAAESSTVLHRRLSTGLSPAGDKLTTV